PPPTPRGGGGGGPGGGFAAGPRLGASHVHLPSLGRLRGFLDGWTENSIDPCVLVRSLLWSYGRRGV
ncbi:hypothetical protein, partial [Nocardia abscessus]|uniref:hypothetical protein n=1 Tax=Nocardia abscessus TaxID=120957 RepID=UPI002456BC5D